MQKEHSKTVSLGKYSMFPGLLLGRGATGTVYQGEDSSSRTPVAIKHIDLATIQDDATRTLLQNEIKALQMLSHPNLLKLHDIVETPGNLYIVTEVLEGGTLGELIAQKGALGELEAMTLFKGILAGCSAIIEAGIIHRDLKPGNIMLHKGTPTVIDFGFCEIILGGIVRAFNVGSPAYMAPEALLRTLYSQKSDSWSLGAILYELLHGQTPDRGTDIKQNLEQLKGNPNLIRESIRPDLSHNVRQILQKSLCYQTEGRMSISGMKYLTEVYLLQHKNKNRDSTLPTSVKSGSVPPSSATSGSQLTSRMAPETVLLPTNVPVNKLPLRQSFQRGQSFQRVDHQQFKNKVASSSIMYTQIPGKRLKENKDRMTAFNSQYLSTPSTPSAPSTSSHPSHPSNPNIRMQPLNFTKMNQQPPNGFISYSDFTRPSAMTYDQNRRSQASSSSIKTGCTTQESIEAPFVSLKDLMVEKLNLRGGAEVPMRGAEGSMRGAEGSMRGDTENDKEKERMAMKSTSSKQIMDRPPGKPMYRQVTVRYF